MGQCAIIDVFLFLLCGVATNTFSARFARPTLTFLRLSLLDKGIREPHLMFQI